MAIAGCSKCGAVASSMHEDGMLYVDEAIRWCQQHAKDNPACKGATYYYTERQLDLLR